MESPQTHRSIYEVIMVILTIGKTNKEIFAEVNE